MKTLFLAEIELSVPKWNGGTEFNTITRPVWATDEDEARTLVHAEYEDHPRGVSCLGVGLYKAIGEPA